MCRLAARSDDAHIAAVAEWVSTAGRAGASGPALEASAEQPSFDIQAGRYRAAG